MSPTTQKRSSTTPQTAGLLPEAWAHAPLLGIDTETTGVDPSNDRIVELGLVPAVGATMKRRRARFNPGCPIPAEASNVHGIYDADVADAPAFGEVVDVLEHHVTGAALLLMGAKQAPAWLVGYNALDYDVPIINAELVRTGAALRLDPARVIDPLIFARWHHRELSSRKLEHIANTYSIPPWQAHSAAADAQAAVQILHSMIMADIVPASPGEALARQATLASAIKLEADAWAHWLYNDRAEVNFDRPGWPSLRYRLMMGCGKYVGMPLDHVDKGYLRYLLDKIDDLPEAVRAIFKARVSPPKAAPPQAPPTTAVSLETAAAEGPVRRGQVWLLAMAEALEAKCGVAPSREKWRLSGAAGKCIIVVEWDAEGQVDLEVDGILERQWYDAKSWPDPAEVLEQVDRALVRTKTKTRSRNREPWEVFVDDCDEVLTQVDDLPDEAEDFAESVRDKIKNMQSWSRENKHVTAKMQIALENMGEGVARWRR